MSPQRPFLSSFFAAFRQQPPSSLPPSTPQPTQSSSSQPSSSTTPPTNKQPSPSTTSYSVSTNTPSTSRGIAAQAQAAAQSQSAAAAAARGNVTSPRGIPVPQQPRRRGSDSSSEGFREVLGADKMYIGGRTAAGEDKYFKLGMVRRVRSGDRLSLDRLSL